MDYSKWKGDKGLTYTEELILHFPKKNWNWYHLSRNANVSMQFVLDHKNYPWDWNALSSNPNLQIDHVINNLDMPWDWRSISQNPGILPKDIEEYPNLPWVWKAVSSNPNVRPEFYERHKNEDWNVIWGLSRNPHFAGKIPFNFSELSCVDLLSCSHVEHADLEYVIGHPEIPWDWSSYTASYVEKYGIEKILETPHLPWEKSQVFVCAPIDDRLLSLPDICWEGLSSNKTLTEDIIERYIDKPWDWYHISFNDNISFEFAMKNASGSDKFAIFGSKKIPESVLHTIKNAKISDVKYNISLNHHITPKIIYDLSDRLDWNLLSINSFLCNKNMDLMLLQNIKDRQTAVSTAVKDFGVGSDVANLIGSYVSWA